MYIDNKKLKDQVSIWLIIMFVLISLMIVVGGLTRLTDSGLSITKWQLFSGILPPLSNDDWLVYFALYKEIPEYKLQNFSMTLSEFKIIFWWEWGHRILGRVIGLTFILPLIYFTFKLKFKNVKNFYFIFFLICFQGFIGWYMVSSGLIDRVDVSHFRLSIHLLIAFLILSLILWNYFKLKNIILSNDRVSTFLPIIFLFLVFTQITIGAFVSGMDAGTIYNSWPLMGNSYFPDDNEFKNIFKINAFSDPSLVQFMHRNLAYIITVFYIFIFLKVYKNKIKNLYNVINILGAVLILQIILGVLVLLFGAHIFYASMHQISSIFLVSFSIYFLYKNKKLTYSF